MWERSESFQRYRSYGQVWPVSFVIFKKFLLKFQKTSFARGCCAFRENNWSSSICYDMQHNPVKWTTMVCHPDCIFLCCYFLGVFLINKNTKDCANGSEDKPKDLREIQNMLLSMSNVQVSIQNRFCVNSYYHRLI